MTVKVAAYIDYKTGILLGQVICLGDSITKIKLDFILENTLLSLLEQITKFQKPEKIRIELQIAFMSSSDLGDLETGFDETISKLRSSQREKTRVKGIYEA